MLYFANLWNTTTPRLSCRWFLLLFFAISLSILSLLYTETISIALIAREPTCHPAITPAENITSATYSMFYLLTQPKLGQYLRIRIEARSRANCPQTTGGDFWFAVLSSLDIKGSTSAPVVDYNNGTYTVDLYVGWAGKLDVNITLVHPSEAVRFLDTVTNISDYSRTYWRGTFQEMDNPNKTDTSLCYLRYHGPKSWLDKCAYTHLKALGNNTAWVCDKPTDGLSCDQLVEYTTEGRLIGKTFQNISKESGKLWLFQGQHYMQRLTKGPQNLHVDHRTRNSLDSSILSSSNLLTIPTRGSTGDGYWRRDVWIPIRHYTHQWNRAVDVGTCLQNKNIYLLGDSTTRQWAYILLQLLRIDYRQKDLQFSYTKLISEFNLNFTFQFYPHILASVVVPIQDEKYEVDVLDSLQSSECNYIVTISPWAHFAQWWFKAYEDRLRLIRESIVRFRKRCPYAPIIVKGPHVRDHGKPPQNAQKQLMSSDYILYKIKLLIEKYFDFNEVYYINVWNMNLAYPVEKNIHMPAAVVTQEIKLFLSYVCQGRSVRV